MKNYNYLTSYLTSYWTSYLTSYVTSYVTSCFKASVDGANMAVRLALNLGDIRIPTGGRLTSWLFTQRGGVEFGTTEDKSIQWQGGGFEPGTSGLQVQRLTTRPRSPPR